MKKILLLICALIVAANSHSQSYHKLIRTNTYWDVYDLGFMYYNSISRIYYTGNDTVIDGNVYKLSRYYPFEPANPPNFIPPFVIDTNSSPAGFLTREDTIMKKVYIYCPDLTPKDQLFYDFSLAVGDTLQSDYNIDQCGNRLVLTSIDSVFLNNGEKRRRFNFHGPASCFYIGNYIESIGGSQGLSLPIIPVFEQTDQFGYLCVSENEINLWENNCNWYFVGINNIEEIPGITVT